MLELPYHTILVSIEKASYVATVVLSTSNFSHIKLSVKKIFNNNILVGSSNNINDPPVINSTDALYKGFLEYTNRILEAQDFKNNKPCDNFYEYTCNKVPVSNYLAAMNRENYIVLINGIKKTQVR